MQAFGKNTENKEPKNTKKATTKATKKATKKGKKKSLVGKNNTPGEWKPKKARAPTRRKDQEEFDEAEYQPF